MNFNSKAILSALLILMCGYCTGGYAKVKNKYKDNQNEIAVPVESLPVIESKPKQEVVIETPPAKIEEPIATIVVEEPVVEEPIATIVVEEPVVEEPIATIVVEEPVVEEPIATIVVEEPVVEEPIATIVVEEPVVEEPIATIVVEEPAVTTEVEDVAENIAVQEEVFDRVKCECRCYTEESEVHFAEIVDVNKTANIAS